MYEFQIHQKLRFLMSDYKQNLSNPVRAIIACGGSIPTTRVTLPNSIPTHENNCQTISTIMHILSDFDASTGNTIPKTQNISSNSLECPTVQKKPYLITRAKQHSAKRIKNEIGFQAEKEKVIGGMHASFDDPSKLAQQSSQVDEYNSRTQEETGNQYLPVPDKKISTVVLQARLKKQ